MSVIGPLELQLLVNSSGFKQQLARETSAGMAEMNRVVKTAVTQADKEFTGLGASATKSLAKLGDAPGLKKLVADAAKSATAVEGSFDGLGDKISADLIIDGSGMADEIVDAGKDAARRLPREFDDVGDNIARVIDTDQSTLFAPVVKAADRAARDLPGQFTGSGRDIAATISREVDAVDISPDVLANVQVDRSTIAADVAAAVDSADVKVQVDAAGVAADVSAAVESARPGIRVDEGGLTQQVERAIERAGNVPLNLVHLTEQVRQAVQQGVSSVDVSADVGRGQGSPLGGLGDTNLLRDFSVAAAADRLDDGLSTSGPARAIVDGKALSDTIAQSISTGAVAGIRVSAPRALADEIEKAVETAEFRPRLNRRALVDEVQDAVQQTDIKIRVDQPAVTRAIAKAVDDADVGGKILGATDRAALKITPDYSAVARDLERVVADADLVIRPNYSAVAQDLERVVDQADIKLPRLEAEVRRSVLEGVERVDLGPIKIPVDYIALAKEMERAVDQSDIKLNIDFDALGADIRKIRNQADIKIGVDVDTREITAAERAFDEFATKLRAGSDVDLDVDTDELRQAFDLASRLDKLVAEIDVTTDKRQLEEAYKLATSLESFAANIDLRTTGTGELQEALRLTDALERIATVSIAVKGTDDLREAARLADDLEKARTIPIDARAEDLVKLDNSIAAAGEAGAEGVAGALTDIDYADIGGSALDQLTGALSAAGPWAAVAGGIGALFGDEFMEGFNNSLPSGRADAIRALRTNLSDAEMAEVGKAGGSAYSAGLSEGLTGAKDAAALIKGELSDVDKGLDLTNTTRQALALEQVFGVDLAASVSTVDKLVSQGLVKNAEEGFNLLFDLGELTGAQFDETVDVTNEFSSALASLGIDGPRGLRLIGEAIESGIFPQVDQAGEVFEEFNEIIRTGGAEDALGKIGIKASDMQDALADGRGAEAMALISDKLLALPDPAQRAALAAEIFGGNMALVADPDVALQLFAQADGLDQVGTGATDAATKIEEAASGMDRLKKVAVGLGDELGTTVGQALDLGNALANADWDSAKEKAEAFGETLAVKLIGPLADIPNRFGVDPFGPLKDAFDTLGITAEELPPKLLTTSDGLKKTGDAGGDAADGLISAEDAVKALDGALDEFAGRFDADALMRQLKEDTDSALESVKGMTGASYDLGTGFDISTAAGREAESALEDLSLGLDDSIRLAREKKISSEELAAAELGVKDTLRQVASQLGLTAEETQELINKYGDVPDDVYTNLRANDYASQVVINLQNALAQVKDKTVTITTKNAFIAATAATAGKRAGGGPTRGLTLAGEQGPELIDFTGPAFVYTADQTRHLFASGAVKAFADGGIADRPSIFGEAGRELALPLEKPARLASLLRDHGGEVASAMGGVDKMFAALTDGLNIPTAPAYADAGRVAAATSAPSSTTTTSTGPDAALQALKRAIDSMDGNNVALRAAVVALERAGRPNVQNNISVDRDHDIWREMALIDEFH